MGRRYSLGHPSLPLPLAVLPSLALLLRMTLQELGTQPAAVGVLELVRRLQMARVLAGGQAAAVPPARAARLSLRLQSIASHNTMSHRRSSGCR